jgi:hypothetical protein
MIITEHTNLVIFFLAMLLGGIFSGITYLKIYRPEDKLCGSAVVFITTATVFVLIAYKLTQLY